MPRPRKPRPDVGGDKAVPVTESDNPWADKDEADDEAATPDRSAMAGRENTEG